MDHREAYGVEAQFPMNEELAFSRAFPPYLCGSRTSREMALVRAEAAGKAITGRQKSNG